MMKDADFTTGEKFAFDPPRISVDEIMAPVSIGRSTIHQIPEIAYKMPISMFPVDAGLLTQNDDWLRPRFLDADNCWDMVVQSWLLIVDDRLVLVDPCTGNGRSNPALPMQHMIEVPYLERLMASGFRPQDVDFVVCTHLHGDHCGWNTELRNGRYVPTFPDARYLMVQREFDRWDTRRPGHRSVSANMGVFENSVLPVLEAGLIDLVADHHQVSESLCIEPAHGHTLAHSLLHLSSAGKEAYFVGDAFHHPLEVRYPSLDMGACEDFTQALATRHRILRAAIDRQALLVPAHFAKPHLGYVREDAGGTWFEPYAAGGSAVSPGSVA